MNALPLDPAIVSAIERRYAGTQIGVLAVSHERLQAMFDEACRTIDEMNSRTEIENEIENENENENG